MVIAIDSAAGSQIRRDVVPADPSAGALFGNPILSVLVVAVTLLIVTCLSSYLEYITSDRPYTIFYLIPVALAAALFGVNGGLWTSLAAVILAYTYLFHDRGLITIAHNLNYRIEFGALLVGTVSVALVVGYLRAFSVALKKAHDDIIESDEARLSFNREVLLAVTGGRLNLCDPTEIASIPVGTQVLSMALVEPADASELRRHIRSIAEKRDLRAIRFDDLETGVTEAATNCIKHGRGGAASIWVGTDSMSVLISDHGDGIAPSQLARATLERGYSSRYSLGMGFTIMLACVDTMALSTSSSGTSILLVVGSGPRPTPEENILARYHGLVLECV